MPVPDRIGKYPVVRLLKSGGMGTLYLCRDPGLPREVAIKVLRSDADQRELQQRFEREIAAVGALRHPNIVTIHGSDVHEGAPFLVMEYIPGETLADVILRRAPLTVARKIEIADEICAALAYAHQRDIVHRDIKPANVMIDTDGTVKVLDFGIAHIGESDLTGDGAMIGTLRHMAPEQVTGARVDPRTDVFALGALLYELLTYRAPFGSSIRDGVVARILHEDPPPLADVCAEVPSSLSAVVMKALQKDPGQRYQNIASMRAALVAASEAMEPTRVVPRGSTTDGPTIVLPREQIMPTVRGERAVATLEDDTPDRLAEAREAMTTGSFDRAMTLCRDVLTKDPSNAVARDLLDDSARRHALLVRRTRRRAIAAILVLALAAVATLWWSNGRRSNDEAATASVDGTAVAVNQPPEDSARTDVEQVPREAQTQPVPGDQPPSRSGREPRPAGERPATEERPIPGPGRASGERPARVDGPAGPTSATPQESLPTTLPSPDSANVPVPPPASPAPIPTSPGGGGGMVTPPAAQPDPAPAPPSSLPPESAPPAPSTERQASSDRTAILQVLARYGAAMTGKNVAEARAVRRFDANTLRTLQDEFRQIRSWEVSIATEGLTVEPTGRRATVTAVMHYDNVQFVGRPSQISLAPITIHLEKGPDGWIITSLVPRR